MMMVDDEKGVYALDTLMTETRRLAAEYHRATGNSLPVSKEIALFDATQHLSLKIPTEIASGVDAVGTDSWEGRKVQLKSRVVFDENKPGSRLGQLNSSGEWNYLILVLLDDNYQPLEILGVERTIIGQEMGAVPNSDRAQKRGAMSVARFRKLADSLWQQPRH